MLGGYVGRILSVDLSKIELREQTLDESLLRRYIGQEGLGARILYDHVEPSVDPLGPDNILMFMTGPLTGVIDSRYTVITKSPLTGILGHANCGGYFGPELKFAGFDGLVIKGRAETPVYLWIDNGKPELRDATHLWGEDTFETEDLIRREHNNPRAQVACIGQAGEKLVRFSAIINDKGRAAGRTGVGAVMGSKRLKAVSVSGKMRIPVNDKARMSRVWGAATKEILASSFIQTISKYGTSGLFMAREEVGYGIVRYWTQDLTEFPRAEELSGETMARTLTKSVYRCYACPVGCGKSIQVENGHYRGLKGHAPEYETIAAFGSQCCNFNLKSVAKANELCNRYGLDTISTGSTVAFAMECYERKLISAEQIGFQLEWGNHQAILRIVEMIAKREGFGDVLADGVKRAAAKIGGKASDFAVHTKGLEFAQHDPRSMYGWGLAYATSGTGGRHGDGFPPTTPLPEVGIKIMERTSTQGLPEMLIKSQNLVSFVNSVGLCYFTHVIGGHISHIPEILSAVTGWETMSWDQILEIGERIFNLVRGFNFRQGMTAVEDCIPSRFLREPLRAGVSKGNVVPLPQMLKEYYGLRGWNTETGKPTKEKLADLGLGEVAADLYSSRSCKSP